MFQMSTLFKYFKSEPWNELPSKLQANERLTVRDIESANKKVKSEIDRNETTVSPGKKPKISYVTYTAEDRASIGRYSSQHGPIIVTGVDDKRQITLVLAATMTGCFLYPQVLYEGKTARCHPSVKFPDGWDVSHTANHWSNERNIIGYLEKIVIPFLKAKREELGLPASQPALTIFFDVFKGQQTDNFKQTLQSNDIQFVAVPANCTDKLLPMDLAINKPLKDAMKKKFQTWYAKEMQQQLGTNTSLNNVKIDFRMSVIKPKSASWLMSSVEEIRSRPLLAINGFFHAGITGAAQSLKSTESLQ